MLRMAVREVRTGWQRLLFFLLSIAVGVGALVGIASFSANLEGAIRREARTLMAADVEISSTQVFDAATLAAANVAGGEEAAGDEDAALEDADAVIEEAADEHAALEEADAVIEHAADEASADEVALLEEEVDIAQIFLDLLVFEFVDDVRHTLQEITVVRHE